MQLSDFLGSSSRISQPSGKHLAREKHDGYIVDSYQLQLNDLESVPAIYAFPEKEGPFPVVLYLHSHGGDFSIGKSEVTKGAAYLAAPSFAETLTKMGYAVWSIDSWGFEERGGISESELYKQFLLTGKTLWGMRLFDVMSLIDYLETREDIDTKRIATIGLSMGGLLSWWASALDPRIKVCIDLAAQVDIETLMEHRRLDHHGFYYYVPNLLTEYTTLAIQEKIAPRPRLSLVGKNDTMCLDEGVEKLRAGLAASYAKKGYPERFVSCSLTGGHMETQEMRSIWKLFLKEYL
ncbi:MULTISPECIES: prolyl oligopeptidase family serine peptidase [unclassified Enterococcus]|uniref:dienelactone hydrolase family protein n=1 Tax=unclassified Enterococcus TaxID=2608891 RepID=UPI0013EA3D67|nr:MULTISPECIES: prolyl oligopeptidase family serine peptidase [unclassified Enterococcus]